MPSFATTPYFEGQGIEIRQRPHVKMCGVDARDTLFQNLVEALVQPGSRPGGRPKLQVPRIDQSGRRANSVCVCERVR